MLSLKRILTKILQSVTTMQSTCTSLQTIISHGSGTYTSQEYVTETNYNRIKLYQQAGTRMGILVLNLQITTALPLSTYVTIGTLPVSPSIASNLVVPPQTSGYGNLLVNVSTNGVIKLYGAQGNTYKGWYRLVIPVILPYAES